MTLKSNNLTLTNGGRVDSSTSGQGNAGSVNITATGDILFDGENLGEPSGATSRVNSEGNGNAGGVTIKSNNLTLSAGGRIDSSTRGQGDEGSVNITTEEDITLRDNSLISAEALENANGGNLTIDARFIIAVPNGNSDIIASAEQGQGGNITIDAQSLFGIEEGPLSDSTNDINASSEFGLSGTVEINILEVDPSRDSLNIPVAPVETEVAQICEPNRDGNQSEFVVTGRGGVPESPEASLNSDFGLEDWRVGEENSLTERDGEVSESYLLRTRFANGLAPQTPYPIEGLTSASSSNGSLLGAEDENSEPIVEADSWMVNDQGKVVLLAHNAPNKSNELAQQSSNCPTD